MGWKGTIRSIRAEVKRQEKAAERRKRELKKMHEKQAAFETVAEQRRFFQEITTLHHHCNGHLDWQRISKQKPPIKPAAVTYRQRNVQARLDRAEAVFLDRLWDLSEWRKKRLKNKLNIAVSRDEKEFQDKLFEYESSYKVWEKWHSLAAQVLKEDGHAYLQALEEYGELSDIPFIEHADISITDKNKVIFDIRIMPLERVIPEEEYSLRQSGTLSVKKMSNSRAIEIYQDYVCSSLLRFAREMFGLLPIEGVQGNVMLKSLNPQSGHLEDQTIISAEIKKKTIETLNLEKIDPSSALNNFIHKAFALCAATDEAKEIRDEVGFFQNIRSALSKSTAGGGKDLEDLNTSLQQLVSKAVASTEMVDIFAAAGLKNPDISILSDEFLAEFKGMERKNLALEMLRKLLKDEIKSRSKKNVVQARNFTEMLESTIQKYQGRLIETAQVIEELINLAREMRNAQNKGEELGLNDDEAAFYDALADNMSAQDVLGDDQLRNISRELAESIKKSTSIDWTVKESVRAKIRVVVKRILRKYGYPPDLQEKATQTVLEQAELLSAEWSQ